MGSYTQRPMLRSPAYRSALAVAALCALVACGSKGPTYPEDHARYVRLDEAIETLRSAYAEQDLAKMESVVLPTEAVDRLLGEARHDFDEFDDIALEFAVERVVIEGEAIDVFLHWQGQWKRSSGEVTRDRGHGVLRWTGGQSILLSGGGGDLPFGMAHRHTVPASSS